MTSAQTAPLPIKRINGRLPTLKFGVSWDMARLDARVAAYKSGLPAAALRGADGESVNMLLRRQGDFADLDALAFYLASPQAGSGVLGYVSGIHDMALDGALAHTGDDRTGAGGGWDEVLIIQLGLLPPEVHTLALVVDSVNGQALSRIPGVRADLVYSAGEELICTAQAPFGVQDTTVIVALLQRQGEDFVVRPVMRGLASPTATSIEPVLRELL